MDRITTSARCASALIFVVDATDETKVLMAAWELYYLAKQLPPSCPVMVVLNAKSRTVESGCIPFEVLFQIFMSTNLPPGTSP